MFEFCQNDPGEKFSFYALIGVFSEAKQQRDGRRISCKYSMPRGVLRKPSSHTCRNSKINIDSDQTIIA